MSTCGWPNHLSELDKFLALTLQSGLLGFDELHSALDKFRRERQVQFKNGRVELAAFCEYLVNQTLLTRWQCEKLRAGQFKGFFLDHFKLLEQVGMTGTLGTYAVEDVRSKRRGILKVGPKDWPHYEIDEP